MNKNEEKIGEWGEPGRYVGAEAVDDDESFDEKMLHLTAKLDKQFGESAKLEAMIRENLRGVGYTSI